MKLFLLSAFVFSLPLLSQAAPEIGKPAPDFTLKDEAGKEHRLADLKGKTVVLEWVNFGCPFVKTHYGAQNMQRLQKAATDDGVVWLTICSSSPGKQGNEKSGAGPAQAKKYGSAASAYLLDEDGVVGQLYGAKTTPEMFIINAEGQLAYMGAIDDQPDTDEGSIAGAKNYVRVALDEMKTGKPITQRSTKSYGCSVKY